MSTSSDKTAKSKTSTKSAAKPSIKGKPELEVVSVNSELSGTMVKTALKKREFLDLVVAESGLPKNRVRPVAEAVLKILGEAVGEGRVVDLQPFGKLKVNREKDLETARVIVAKIRQSKESGSDKDE